MSKRDWYYVIFVLLAVIAFDQSTKWLAFSFIQRVHDFGFLILVKHRNPGAMLGMFSTLPPVLRVVTLSTAGVFLIFVYSAIQYLLPQRSLRLRIGLSFLLGGIIGNVIDRTILGSVMDFLVLRTPWISTAAFNMADALQWIGYVLVVYSLIKEADQLWPDQNTRKQIWINPSFQRRYVGILIFIGVCFSFVSGVFSFTYLKITIDDLTIGQRALIESKFLGPFLITYLSICMSFIIALFIVGRVLSHRVAGPLYAFEKYVNDLLSGKDRQLKLRAGDEFIHLTELAEKIRIELQQKKLPSDEKINKN